MTQLQHTAILPASRDQVILSVNPKAGRRSSKTRVERLEKALAALGLAVETLTDLEIVAQKANTLHEAGKLRALVGIGGDGTAAELTNRTQQGVPISLLPSGTANLLAKHFKYSFNPEKFAQMIAAGKVATLDAARANGRLFLAMVGCGFDAEVVEQVHTARMQNPKGAHIGYCSYIKPILRAIGSYKYPLVNVQPLDDAGNPVGEAWQSHWAFLCNIPKYGWGVPVAPRASLDDGRLNLCLWRGGSLFQGLYLTAVAQMGIHGRFRRCTVEEGTRYRFTPVDDGVQIPYQLDGDPGGCLPLDVAVEPGRLTLIVR